MTAPNIASLSSLYFRSEEYKPTTTESSGTANASGSGTVYAIKSILVANINGAGGASANITIKRRVNVSGTPVEYHIADEIEVPGGSTLEIVPSVKNLEEDQDIRLLASANSALEVTIDYAEFG